MLKHAFKRLLVLLPAVWLIASVVFLLSKTVPGQASETEFEQAAQSANSRAKNEAYQRAYRQMLHRTGQDLPLFYFRLGSKAETNPPHPSSSDNLWPEFFWYGTENQYHRWFKNLLHGDLGVSNRDSRAVTEIVAEAFAVTWWLAVVAFVLIAVLAPEIAMVLSRKSNRTWRSWLLNALYGLESIPLFVLALLVLTFSSYAGWLYDFPEEVSRGLVIFCLVLVNLPYLTGQAYAAMQTTLQENYVLTARAKGLPDKMVLRKHVLRNSLLPVITLLSDFFPALLAGTVMLEVIFSVPGMGRLLVSSVLTRDYEVITGIVLLVGVLKMLSHLLADLLYAVTDPRINR